MKVKNYMSDIMLVEEIEVVSEHKLEFGCDGNCYKCDKYWDDECLDFTPSHIKAIDDFYDEFCEDNDYGLTQEEVIILNKRIEEETMECISRKMTDEEIKKYCNK
jgi:hypothetical protein